MAINVSTILSVCLYCKTNSETDGEKEFHEIFDEVGLELQLPTLVEKFFHKKLINKGKQLLCEDCVNRLIEFYDLEEHAKEERDDEVAVKSESDIYKEKTSGHKQTEINEPEIASPNVCEEIVNQEIEICGEIQNDQVEVAPKNIANVPYNSKIRASHNNDTHYDKTNTKQINQHIEDHEYEATYTIEGFDYDSGTFISNLSEEVSPNGEHEAELLKDNESTNESPISNQVGQELIHNKYQEIKLGNIQEVSYLSTTTNDDSDSDVQLINNIDEITLEGTESSSEEFEINKIQTDNKVPAVHVSETEKIYFPEQKDLTEENIYEDEETLLEYISQKSDDNASINLDDIEEIREDDSNEEFFQVEDIKPRVGKNVDEKASKINQNVGNTVEIDNSKDLSDNETYEYSIVMEEMPENTPDENMTMEEEYLVEELISCDEFDSVDLNEYFDKNVMTKFEQLELQWSVECKLCLQKYDTLQDLLKHSCINKLFKKGKPGCCFFKECDETVNNLKSLARHLILFHYEKIESLPIYSSCTDCEKRFSNLIDLNKHSCCRTIKRKAGARNFCQSCNLDFQSLKRYIFHMQFHLTKHRPKVCLLCGALFSNSNDFFDHTQYKHEPDISMACMKCDRFFKDKFVYEKHMEIHDETKSKFACTHCPKKYTKRSGLTTHMEIYHNLKTKNLKCKYCDKEFATLSSYRSHKKSHVPESELPAFVCSECGLVSSSCDTMKDHVEMDEESPCNSAIIIQEILSACYTCENCSMDFHTKGHLQKHRLSKNHCNKSFYCPLCRKAFTNLRHMRNHATNHKDYQQWEDEFPILRLYMCKIGNCEEAYSLWTTLYYHMKKPHKRDKELLQDFKCQFCQKSCTTKMSLAVHIARSHGSSNVNCSHCERTFKNKTLLQNHINKFHVVVYCSICDKDFKNRRNLDAHTNLVHDNIKRYFCRHCKKGYFFKSEMEYHEKNVHPDVSYNCEICNFVTTYPKSLEIHMNNHNKKLSFKCKICSKTFGRKQLLNVHMKRHEEFACSEQGCNAVFLTHNLMKTHIRNVHKRPKEDHKKVNTNERKRSSKKSPKKVHKKSKGRKITTEEDTDSEKDSIDLKVNEILGEDFASDNEYED